MHPPLRRVIKKLFLKVHPDLFAKYPREQTLNQRSVASLNQLLDALEDSSHLGQTFALHMCLRARNSPSLQPALNKTICDGLSPVRVTAHADHKELVELRTSLRVLEQDSLLTRTHLESDLRCLFRLTDVPTQFSISYARPLQQQQQQQHDNFHMRQHQRQPQHPSSSDSLSSFVYDFRGEALERQQNYAKAAVPSHIALTSLRMRGLRVVVDDSVEALAPTEQEAAFQRVQKLVSSPITNMIVVLSSQPDDGSAPPVDERGRLRLNIKDDLDKWRSLVHDDAIQSQASFRNQAWTTTKERENAVCEMIGLYSLFCEPALLSDPTYLSFLERIENAKDLFADMFRAQPLLAGLTVHVHRKPAFALDKTMGFLSVPVTAEAHKVLWFMKMRGEEAMFITKSFNERSKNFDSVSRLLKRRLRLRRLDRTEDVSVEEMTRACQRLLSLPTELRYLMFGLNLRIARSYDIAEDGAMCIPHDFEL